MGSRVSGIVQPGLWKPQTNGHSFKRVLFTSVTAWLAKVLWDVSCNIWCMFVLHWNKATSHNRGLAPDALLLWQIWIKLPALSNSCILYSVVICLNLYSVFKNMDPAWSFRNSKILFKNTECWKKKVCLCSYSISSCATNHDQKQKKHSNSITMFIIDIIIKSDLKRLLWYYSAVSHMVPETNWANYCCRLLKLNICITLHFYWQWHSLLWEHIMSS